jgi:hypothetical protein
MAMRTATRVPKGLSATVPRVMTTISAERTKSVRMAPRILVFSVAMRWAMSMDAERARASSVLGEGCSSCCLWRNLCASF